MRACVAPALAAGLALGCARTPQAPPDVPDGPPPGFPAGDYAAAIARGDPVFRVDPSRSLVVVHVGRDGPLARFGHDHVVASRDVRGYADLAHGAARADLYAPLGTLTVDEPRLRAQAGLDTQPRESDVAATRRNMLAAVLEVDRYPFVLLSVRPAAGEGRDGMVEAAVTLHGHTRRIALAVELDRPGADALRARGRFALDQTDFGIVPFAALGGALRVADRLEIEFSLYVERAGAP